MKTLLFAIAMAFTASVGFIAGADTNNAVIEERLQESLHSEEFVIDVNMDGSIHGSFNVPGFVPVIACDDHYIALFFAEHPG